MVCPFNRRSILTVLLFIISCSIGWYHAIFNVLRFRSTLAEKYKYQISITGYRSIEYTTEQNATIQNGATIKVNGTSMNVALPEKKLKRWCDDMQYQYPSVLNYSMVLEQDEKWRKINPPPYNNSVSWVHSPSKICQFAYQTKLKIVLIVKSRVKNFELRNVIRNTWAKEASKDGNEVVFSLGLAEDNDTEIKASEEIQTYDDIIQGNFTDAYFNNTYKTTMNIEWAAEFCGNTDYVTYIDDDVYLNYKNLIKFLHGIPKEDRHSLFTGELHPKPVPRRGTNSKWFLPGEKFAFKCYPQFISGGTTLASTAVVRSLSLALPYVKRFKFDDVYVGILAQKLGIIPSGNSKIVMRYSVGPEGLKNMIAVHGYSNPIRFKRAYKIVFYSKMKLKH